jgi:hypothetical protein
MTGRRSIAAHQNSRAAIARLRTRLTGLVLLLALPALACGIPTGATPGPAGSSETPIPIEVGPGSASVNLWESSFSDANGWNNSPYFETLRFPDVNGDGLADACGRGISGVNCGVSNGSAFSAVTLWESSFSDANGWNGTSYWNTLQYPDVNGDGKADVCGRGLEGVNCGLSDGSAFSAALLWEKSFSDANGWNNSPYFETLRFPDLNGDGKADVCGRGIAGEYCGLSSGTVFSAVTLWEGTLSDANGWNTSPYWNSIQFADVNGDGKDDLCARGILGEYCGVSSGASFAAVTLWESNFSDANGWNNSPYWNSIQFADVNGDSKADVCGRGITGMYCGLSNGSSFSAVAQWESSFSDANGWNASPYWDTLRLADVNGDGKADVCGRGLEGVNCGLSNGSGFSAAALWDNNFSDANGWKNASYWNTIQFPDLNHDGQADVCGRGIEGVYCGLSNGSSFQAAAP